MSIVLEYTLTPRGRVSAGASGEVQNGRTAHEVIPGSVVRGALGATWWRSPATPFHGGEPAEQGRFDRLFAAFMKVGFAHPSLAQTHPVLEAISWVRCKYPTQPGCRSAWFDEVAGRQQRCPGCDKTAMARGKGWSIPPHWTAATTRTALTAEGTAQEDQLFTRSAMRPDVTYTGRITIDVLDRTMVEEELAWLTQPMDLSIGGQRSTMGRSRWTCRPVDAPAAPQPAAQLVVRLTSPAILVDEYGAPQLDLARALDAVVSASAGSGDIADQWTRTTTVSGWHGVAGIPKPEEWALQSGSTGLLQDWDASALNALNGGLGLRRNEGYGAIEILTIDEALTRAAHAGQPQMEHQRVPAPSAPAGAPLATTHDHAQEAGGPVEVLVSLLPGENRRAALSGLTAAARNILRTREHGFPEAIIAGRIEQSLGLPWARDLAGEARSQVEAILSSPDLRGLTDRMTTFQRDQP